MRIKLITSILSLGLMVLVVGMVGCGKSPEQSRIPNFYGISIYPHSVTIMAGASVQFKAVGNYDDGSTKEVNPVWSVESGGGKIDENGLYTAPSSSGSATIKAQVGDVYGTVNITITAASLETILITPDVLTIEANTEFIGFFAKGKDKYGNEVYISPEWSFDNENVGSFYSSYRPDFYAKETGTGEVKAIYSGLIGVAKVIVTPDVTPPPTPKNLVGTPEYQGVNLRWDRLDWTGNKSKFQDLKQYNVYRTTNSGSGYIKIGDNTEEGFKDKDLTNGVTYYYVVTSIDYHGNESAYSNEIGVVPGSTAKNIYVDANYNGEETGTREKPFNTINEAIAAAVDGDTIFVETGTYIENLVLSKNLHLIGAGIGRSTIKCADTSHNVVEFRNVKNGKISGFTISGARDVQEGIYNYAHYGLYIYYSSVEVSNNEFKENYCSNDIYISSGHGTKILNNEFPYDSHYPITSPLASSYSSRIQFIGNFSRRSGIKFDSGQNIEIANNNLAGQIQIDGASEVNIGGNYLLDGGIDVSGDSSNVRISNNIITGNSIYGIYTEGTNISIINNTIDNLHHGDFGLSGVKIVNGSAQIFNNIITNVKSSSWNNSWGYGIKVDQGATAEIRYNNVWNNATNYSGCSAGTGDISSDPKFVSLNDYHLANDSPCIDAGSPDSVYNDVNGTRNDMGAYGGPDPYNL